MVESSEQQPTEGRKGRYETRKISQEEVQRAVRESIDRSLEHVRRPATTRRTGGAA